MNPETDEKPKLTLGEQFSRAYRTARPALLIICAVIFMSASVIPTVAAKLIVLGLMGGAIFFILLDLSRLLSGNIAGFKSTLADVTAQSSELPLIRIGLTNLNENISKIEDPLHKAAFNSELPGPEAYVARHLYSASQEAIVQMLHPRSYGSHPDYTKALGERIDKMIAAGRGTINAACGEKAWEDRLVKGWFDKNYDALKVGVSINRIFLEEKEWDAAAAVAQMQHQADNGINVRFSKLSELSEIEALKDRSRGFGFVIFDFGDNKPEVIVHNDPLIEKAVLFDHPMIVGQFISTFNELSSEFYSEVIGPKNADDAGNLLKKEIMNKAEKMTARVARLVHHRYSNLHRDFVNWRLETELQKVDDLIGGEIEIRALDKFAYLRDVFKQIMRQLNEGDTYKTLSTIEFWSGDNIGSSQFLEATLTALNRKAKMDRIVFIDRKLLEKTDEREYHRKVKSVIKLFESFAQKTHPDFELNFFVGDQDGEFVELLKHAPLSLITEFASGARPGITTRQAETSAPNRDPYLNLKFYEENESDRHSRAFDEDFGGMKSRSTDLEGIKALLETEYPHLAGDC